MKNKIKIKPPFKWAGGKGQLIEQFELLLPKKFDLYIEPFVGGGALFFNILPSDAILIDLNFDVVNFYTVVKNDVEKLIDDLKTHRNESEYYYMMRSVNLDSLNSIQRASRFLYLNKTAYNGLWRVNKKGNFNVPFGRYKNPKILDEDNLRNVSLALRDVSIIWSDFSIALDYAKSNTFVYFDPPYHPLSKTSNFTNYSGTFNVKDQIRLAECFKLLDKRGCFLMLSNSNTPLVRQLYANYDVHIVRARRMINSKAEGRGEIEEIVVRNFST
ncbi:MAG: DNA adenine methylase [Thermotogae bacterium]|jgi:DNA adenine methylase|nr:DNA adenine methylase [Thermotogota bacterium]